MTIEDARHTPGSFGTGDLGPFFIAGRPSKEELRKQLA